MRLPLIRTMMILTAAACGTALIAGCDDSAGERSLRKDLETSHQLAAQGSEQSISEARSILERVSVDAGASPAVKANAKALLAQIELEAARAAQREIDRHMMDLARVIGDVMQLRNQIATANALVAGYRTYDPREALAVIQKNIADATGGPDKPAWFTHENSQIPTLAALRQNISKLEGELASLQEKLAGLQAQRTQVLAEAEQAAKAAEAEQDQQKSFEAFSRASERRKAAADLATQIQTVEAAMLPVERDLEIARSQAQVIERLVQDLNEQAQALQTGWQMIQQQMGAQTSLAQTMLEGGAGVISTTDSIQGKAGDLTRIVNDLAEQRELAIDNARNAVTHFGEAVNMADELRREIQPRVSDPQYASRGELKGWKLLVDVMQPSAFRLNQAAANRVLAQIYGSQAQELRMRTKLGQALLPVLQAANLPVPDPLSGGNLESQMQEALTSAAEAYKESDEILVGVTESPAPEEIQNAAYIGRVLTLYAWAQLNREAGDTRAAQERLAAAREVRNLAAERNISFPAMPGGLGEPPAPATTPAETPAEEPAETPAETPEGATPAEPPAGDAPPPAEAPSDTPVEPPADQPADTPAPPPAPPPAPGDLPG